MPTFEVNFHRQNKPLEIALVGVGGTGSEVLLGLINLHQALILKGHPGLNVTAYDPDSVSPANLIRQRFYAPDLGLNKADILIRRINVSTALNWRAVPEEFTLDDARRDWDIVISCVDTRRARAVLHQGAFSEHHTWGMWMDYGNEHDFGQVIIGQPGKRSGRLPCATEIHAELTDLTTPEDDTPSCSAIEALEKQDLFINSVLARLGLQLLWKTLSQPHIEHHGYYLHLGKGQARALHVPPLEKQKGSSKSRRTGRQHKVREQQTNHPSVT